MAATFSHRARSCSFFIHRWALGIALAAGFTLTAPASACPQFADLNGDEQVDVFDLLELLGQWGPCPQGTPCPADLTNSGGVDVHDLLFLLNHWGPAPLFDYGPAFENQEAVQIGIEMLGPNDPPTLPVAMYDRIVVDLDRLRDAVPFLQGQTHQPMKNIDRMMVGINPLASQAAYNCLNAFYGVTNEQYIFSHQGTDWYELHFPAPLNVAILAEAYLNTPAVQYADTSIGMGFDLVLWVAQVVDEKEDRWSWNVHWSQGPICTVDYVFETTADGELTLISFETGHKNEPWCPAPTESGFE